MAKAKSKRKAIPDSIRFEVFKRDQFRCQYCGRCAPDAVLVVDHIDPVAKGGGNEIVNLITSCRECNSGKSDRRLDDDSIIAKQRAQLEDLAERRAQIEMMMKWRAGLSSIENDGVEAFCAEFQRLVGFGLTPTSREEARKMISKFGLAKCLDAIARARDQYFVLDHASKAANTATRESAERIWRSVWVFAQPADTQAAYLIRAILRNKLNDQGRWLDSHKWQAMSTIKQAMSLGVPVEWIKDATMAMGERFTFADWRRTIEELRGE